LRVEPIRATREFPADKKKPKKKNKGKNTANLAQDTKDDKIEDLKDQNLDNKKESNLKEKVDSGQDEFITEEKIREQQALPKTTRQILVEKLFSKDKSKNLNIINKFVKSRFKSFGGDVEVANLKKLFKLKSLYYSEEDPEANFNTLSQYVRDEILHMNLNLPENCPKDMPDINTNMTSPYL